jgi:hypothetical protein
MTRNPVLWLLVGILAIPLKAAAQPCTLPAMSWMAGTWLNSADPKGSQERWVIAPGDVLMGSAWEFPAGHAGYAEVMTIRTDGNRIAMFLRHFDGGLRQAWEERAAPMVFAASSCAADTAVFDGEGEHAGEHLTYTRAGGTLHIVADFLHHGKADHEEWHMLRSSD